VNVVCYKCEHEWEYTGKSLFYITCPKCQAKLSLKKIQRLQIEKSTRQALSSDKGEIIDVTLTRAEAIYAHSAILIGWTETQDQKLKPILTALQNAIWPEAIVARFFKFFLAHQVKGAPCFKEGRG